MHANPILKAPIVVHIERVFRSSNKSAQGWGVTGTGRGVWGLGLGFRGLGFAVSGF